ncbi:hypothetical protein WDW37_09070 [Bdellovibrionota bacterium FG-1]
MKQSPTKRVSGFLGFLGFITLLAQASAFASIPPCLGHGKPLSLDNNQALVMKKSAPLGKTFRAHVAGQVTRVFPDKNGHAHFEIQIGKNAQDVLEVVYSEDFGDMPDPSNGAQVEACGDFINAYAANNGYPPSPSGAIIHWVHRSDSAKHDSGYVYLDNVVYGYGKDGKPRSQLFN